MRRTAGAPALLAPAAGDGKPGDVTCQAVGGVWWVVGADGKKITKTPASSTGSSY